jgi:hypothetical protein
LLDEGSATSSARVLTGPDGATACRVALPTTPAGVIQPTAGEPVQPALAGDDPRWERPLPWATAIPSNPQPQTHLSVAWLALLNVVVPLAILRLATRKRISSLRLLMALPAAVAVPVAVFLSRFGSLTPPLDDPSTWVAVGIFALTSLAGLPVLIYLTSAAVILLRRRWRRFLALIGLTVVVSVVLSMIWLR